MSVLNWPLRLRFSSHTRLQMSFTRSMMDSTSVIPGNMGEMKQVVRPPASWNAFMAASLLPMGTARSMSSLNPSSRVLMDQETLASGKSPMRSRSRNTRSDLMAMLSFAPDPLSCSSSSLVLPNSASSGRYGSVTEPMNSSFPAYLEGSRMGDQCFTSRNVPHGSGWLVKRFMKHA